MPWQQYAADVFGEIDPKTGLRVYRHMYMTLMRQQGKTTFVVSAKVHRALDAPEPQLIQFAAQDGVEAKKKWLQHIELLERTPLASKFEAATSNGKEAMTWNNGSTEFPVSSKPASGHGDALDLGLVTEAMAHQDDRYEVTMHGAMLARPDAQFLAESAQGNALSIYWNAVTEEHRARLEAEPDSRSRVAYIDYSFDEKHDDIGDPQTWLKRIPGIGHTIRLDDIQHEWDTATTPQKLRKFKRGIGNIADIGEAGDAIFDEDDWSATGDDHSYLVGARLFSLDVTNDRTWSSVSWAGANQEGLTHTELIAHDRGTHWVIPFLVDKLRRNSQSSVTIIANTQAALMQDDLEDAGISVLLLSKAEYAAACARYHDKVADHTIRHLIRGQTPLDIAVGGATWTTTDLRTFNRKDLTIDISPLISCATAAEAHRISLENSYNVLDSIA